MIGCGEKSTCAKRLIKTDIRRETYLCIKSHKVYFWTMADTLGGKR